MDDRARTHPSTAAPVRCDAAEQEHPSFTRQETTLDNRMTEIDFANQFLEYINATPTPFHLCAESIVRLKAQGFTELSESEPWGGPDPKVLPGGKYFYTRNMSTLVAFAVGGAAAPDSIGGFKVAGAHTDSPVLKVKPSSKRSSAGYLQVNVETYGGGLWHTWFDRELSLAGCVIVETSRGKFERRLVHVKRALLRVPTLCIHLQSAEERASFAPNKETHMQPILAMLEETLDGKDSPDARHPSELLRVLATELGCELEAIKDFELTLCDTQPGCVWGLSNEFLSSPRLDNQVHCWTALSALLTHASSPELESDPDVSMIALFDHEEVGSESACGAGSPVFQDALARVAPCVFGAPGISAEECTRVCIQKSFLVSADVAHAVHPNYASKHEAAHSPKLNKGTVIKTNDNQRYATNAVTGFMLREICRRAEVDTQEFVVKNDCPCGTTIGPIIAAKVGVRTVDIGVPSLSMHSIRETCGVADISSNYRLLLGLFKEYRGVFENCEFETSKCFECK
eukprot:TRINITY_DN15228_c0_g1_i1.p1 TRINITY_DN15228_c0_g1~~TRINITY_DN15228_c0_g1_i1.p1  ORF type:complete len:514 (+),score=138.42 TRINITY_DN15228_c0_g1_i1:1-1542(+)